VEALSATVEGNQVHVSFRAADSFSPIKRAEYSIDANDWQFVEPVGQLSDAKSESYDFKTPIPTAETWLRGTGVTPREPIQICRTGAPQTVSTWLW